jgi:hypothetical protein
VRRFLRTDRAATDPILVIAAIAVSLVLLVGGGFAVTGLIASGHDANAKSDLGRVAAAESALLDTTTSFRWSGPVNASQSVEESDSGSAVNLVTHPWNVGTSDWSYGFGDGAGSTTSTADTRLPGGTTAEQTWATTSSTTVSVFAAAHEAISVLPARRYVIGATVAASNWPGFQPTFYMNSGEWAGPATIEDRGDGALFVWRTWIAPAAPEVQHPTISVEGQPPQAGSSWRVSGAIFIDAASWTGYFDGASAPQRGALPYLTESGATLEPDLQRDSRGVPARALERQAVGFTPTDGATTAVTTNADGSAWVAVTKSTTGRLWMRSSLSATTVELTGAAGSRVPVTAIGLPPSISISDVNQALMNTGRF